MKVIDERKGSGKVGCLYYMRVRKQQSAGMFPHNTKANKVSIHLVCQCCLRKTMKSMPPYTEVSIHPPE